MKEMFHSLSNRNDCSAIVDKLSLNKSTTCIRFVPFPVKLEIHCIRKTFFKILENGEKNVLQMFFLKRLLMK